MSSAHIIFIPAVLAMGIFIGFLLGSRVAQDRINLELKRQAEREEARRKRAERKAGQGQAAPAEPAPASTSEAESVKAKKAPPR
jgi:hypothetical protein